MISDIKNNFPVSVSTLSSFFSFSKTPLKLTNWGLLTETIIG